MSFHFRKVKLLKFCGSKMSTWVIHWLQPKVVRPKKPQIHPDHRSSTQKITKSWGHCKSSKMKRYAMQSSSLSPEKNCLFSYLKSCRELFHISNFFKFKNKHKHIFNQQKQEESKPSMDDEWAGINFTVDNETGTYKRSYLFYDKMREFPIENGAKWIDIVRVSVVCVERKMNA